MYAKISEISFYLPEKLSLKKEYKKIRFNKIFSKTGIEKVRISKSNHTAINLAELSSKNIVRKYKNIIDTIIYVTQSPEYNLPSGSCILQHKLGLKNNIKAFDINQGCSGYIYGLSLASSLVESGQSNNVLLICSDTYRKYIKNKNNSCYPIFSDGASTTLIKSNKKIKKFIDFKFGTDGSGYLDLIVPNSGSNYDKQVPEIFMDGKKVLMFTMNNVPDLIKKILFKNKLKIKDIKFFIFHQASKIVLENLKYKLSIPSNKLIYNLKEIGNTVSSTIPINIANLIKNKKIKKGDKVLLVGFGVGYSMGATIINW